MVKPYSVNHIPTKIRGRVKYRQCIINPVDSEEILFDQPGLMLTNLVTKVNKKGQVPMVLVNHTDRTVVLKRGQTLGVAEDIKYSDVFSIEDNIAVENCCNEVNMNNKPLEGIKLDQLPKEKRQKLEDLLHRYEPSLFANST